MGSDSYSVEDCRALLASDAGREELNPVVARACGLTLHIEPGHAGWRTSTGDFRFYASDCDGEAITPPYLTTASGAPGYGDRCLEMIEALRTVKNFRITSFTGGNYGVTFNKRAQEWVSLGAEARTLADALCLALAAAGLLHKEDGDDGT